MGAILCCLRGPDEDEAAARCCLCLPWPFLNNNHHHHDSGAAARQRADPLVAPVAVQRRVPPAGSAGSGLEDSMNTFRCPPRPLPYDDPQFIHQMEQHPLVVAAHDKASTRLQKSIQLQEESNNANVTSARAAAEKADGSSRKAQSKIGGTQVVDVPSDGLDDCPICLEEYDYENPKIELQCNHNFHLGCIYEWMERSQSCPLCAKVMLFNEDQ